MLSITNITRNNLFVMCCCFFSAAKVIKKRQTDNKEGENILFPHLFSQELLVEIIVEGLFVVIADRQVGILIEDDAVLVDLLYLLQVDDIRAVDAHELSFGQIVKCSRLSLMETDSSMKQGRW